MKRVIYKYPLDLAKEQELLLPFAPQLLCVQVQNNQPYLWAIVDLDCKSLPVTIKMYGTGNGNPHPDDKYLGTVQLDGFVWHYFEASR